MGNRIWIPEVRMYMDDDTGDFSSGPPPANYGQPGETIPNGDSRQFIKGPDGQPWPLASQTVSGGVQSDTELVQREGLQPGQYTTQNGLTYLSPQTAMALGQKYGGNGGLDGLLEYAPLAIMAAAGGLAASGAAAGGAGAAGASTGAGGITIGNAPGILGEGAGFMPVSALSNGLPAASMLSPEAAAGAISGASGGGLADFLKGPTGGFPGGGGGGNTTNIPGLGDVNLNDPNLGDLPGGFQTVNAPGTLGAPYQPDFNLLDPSTYSGAGGSSILDFLKGLPGSSLGNLLKGGAQAGLGYLGANQQQKALQDVQNQWLALGAPSRARYEASFAPGFDLREGDPAIGQMWSDLSHSAAAKYGNPFDSPSAQGEILGGVWNRGYLPQLNTYRSQNLTGGQLGTNTAGTASLTGASTAGGGLNAIGYGLNTALSPDDPYSGLAKLLQNNYKLTV